MHVRIVYDPKLPNSHWGETGYIDADKTREFGFVMRLQPQLKGLPMKLFCTIMHEFSHIAFFILHDLLKKRSLNNMKYHHKFIEIWETKFEQDLTKVIPKRFRKRRK